MIGQDHVTEPLRRALRSGRVGHAYLFSGPRGCGKTTSARILARCLNCAEGPTDTPCGVCDSCRDLARGGSGSLDVVEIDAASHGGVDDARELRERASFAPVRDRFKVFIIDEAHMVTSAGFNALLKLVEEPPEHVKFIFATTEPDKVIGTIRSRTHHYPFRLIPPQILLPYLEGICRDEGVSVADGVLSLAVRSGGGSARDTLSVLDQLIAGSDERGVELDVATNLLGFTDVELLNRSVDAIAHGDAPALFTAIDEVIGTGHEPRRFVEDLLERFRDLIVVVAAPDQTRELLPDVPVDQVARLTEQSGLFQPRQLTDAAQIVSDTLGQMVGATSPRLHLELLAAKLVLRISGADGGAYAEAPAAGGAGAGGAGGSGGASLAGRSSDGGPSPRERAMRAVRESASEAQTPPAQAAAPAQAPTQPAPEQREERQQAPAQPAPTQQLDSREPEQVARSATPAAEPAIDDWGLPVTAPAAASSPSAPDAPAAGTSGAASTPETAQQTDAPAPSSAPESSSATGPSSTPAPSSASGPAESPAPAAGAGEVEQHWSAIMDALQRIRRPSWALIAQNAGVHSFDGSQLVLDFRSPGLVQAFYRGTAAANMAEAVKAIMHVSVSVEATSGGQQPPAGPAPAQPAAPAPATPTPASPSPASPTPSGTADPGSPASTPAASSAPSGPADSRAPAGAPAPAPSAAATSSTSPSESAKPGGRWGDALAAVQSESSRGADSSRGAASSQGPGAARAPEAPGPAAPADSAPDEPDWFDDVPPEDPYGPPENPPFERAPAEATQPTAPRASAPDAAPAASTSSSSERPVAGASAPSLAPSPAPATAGDVPAVQLPPQPAVTEPRTHGQMELIGAMRRAYADQGFEPSPSLIGGAADVADAPQSPDTPQGSGASHGPSGSQGAGAAQHVAAPQHSGEPQHSSDPQHSSTEPPLTGAAMARAALRKAQSQPSNARGFSDARTRPGAPAEDDDPFGGASLDDADATGTGTNRRPGREVVEDVLGGELLEVIDESPATWQ